jgi:hypothetical protein
MHHSKLPLTTWFWAAGLVATHSDRVSVRLFQGLFTISAQSAQLLMSKFVTILVAYGGRPLEGLVQVDHTEFQLRAADGSVNLSLSGKVKIVVAIEMSSDRVRAAQLSDDSATLIETFVRSNVKRGELLLTKGHSSFLGLVDYRHDPRGIGKALWRTERMLALATTFLRKHHGLPREEVEYALNDFLIRQNRRARDRQPTFDTLMELALGQKPTTHWDIVGRENPRKGTPTVRRNPRHRRTATGMRQDGSGSIRPLPVSARPPSPRGH